MNNKLKSLLLIAAAALALGGCNVGNAPAGMSGDEARANFEKQPPEEQIKMIQGSPASAEEKARRIAEIRQKHNLPDPSDGGGAPAGGPPTGGGFPGDPRAAGG